ncbi:MAG: flhF [Proteobacteria bacterium]|nr:flhF [Pseudomonadota bacterium]
MNVKKFIAANARDALRKVKETLGSDAIILSNRGVPGGVEIMAVAARDMAMIVPTQSNEDSTPAPRRPIPAPIQTSAPVRPAQTPILDIEDDYLVRLTSARAALARPPAPAPAVTPPAQGMRHEPVRTTPIAAPTHSTVNAGIPKNTSLRNLELPPRQNSSPAAAKPAQAEVVQPEVMGEIRELRKMFEQHLAGFAWGETARREPVKAEVLRQMLDSGFSPKFARELLAELPLALDVNQALAWAKGAADRNLLTIGANTDIIDRGGIYALVGPTGVGKTTTTAKLAARSVLRHGPAKVALVTTDSYRIGAHEQLKIYGRILGVPVYLVKDGSELRHTLAELQHKHIVIVDTMGMSQKDKLVPELTDMLSDCNVQRLLLLSCTARGDTLDDVVRAYASETLAGCILTKVDEAASLASTLDVIMRHGMRLHYVSNGQRVPEDLHLPNRAYLIHRAFKDVPEASPHHYDAMESSMAMASAGMAAVGGRRG